MSVSVPVVDLEPFRLGSGAERLAVAGQVGRCCEEIGFLLVAGHGVPDELVESTYAVSRAFFDLPAEEKSRLSAGEPVLGSPVYRPLASESLAASLGQATASDLKESLDFGPTLAGVAWPARPPELEGLWQRYLAAMLELGETIMRAFALALGLDEGYFRPFFDDRSSSLRAINYPAPEGEALPGQLRAGAHRDYGCLTILRTEAAPGGLQVETRAGEWMDVPSLPGAFVVNIGDLMARWTNDRWVSTLHRVVNPPPDERLGSRRQSLVFFHNPRSDALVECLPDLRRPDDEPKYEPVTAGDYVLAKADRAFAAARR